MLLQKEHKKTTLYIKGSPHWLNDRHKQSSILFQVFSNTNPNRTVVIIYVHSIGCDTRNKICCSQGFCNWVMHACERIFQEGAPTIRMLVWAANHKVSKIIVCANQCLTGIQISVRPLGSPTFAILLLLFSSRRAALLPLLSISLPIFLVL